MLLRAVIADAAFAGVYPYAHADGPEDFPDRLRLGLPAAIEFDQLPPHRLGGAHGVFGVVGIVERSVPECHDAVAEVSIDRSLLRSDDFGHRRQETVQKARQLSGIRA